MPVEYKKLSCRRETARCFLSSRSFEMTALSRACVSPYCMCCLHCNHICISYRSEIFSIKQWRDLKIWVKMIPFESLGTVFYLHGSNLYHFRDKVRYWAKIAIFHTLVLDALIRRSPPDYCHTAWYRKTTMISLVWLRNWWWKVWWSVWTFWYNTDTGVWQTDGQTNILQQHSLSIRAVHSTTQKNCRLNNK